MRYVVFSGCGDYSADMRNVNDNIDLWLIRRSDYAGDMQNLSAYNDLRQGLIFATEAIGVRAPSLRFPGFVSRP